MPSEHKIKINDTKKLHASLKRLNTNQMSISKIKDIYFKQPNGTVLKIRSEEGKPDRVIHFKKVKDGFEQLDILEITIQNINEKFEIDKVLDKSVSKFETTEFEIEIHSILEVGDFLVINKGTRAAISKLLDLPESDFFSTSFNEL